MEKPSEFSLAIAQVLDALQDYFDAHSKITVHEKPDFTEIVKATIIKAYEFALSINKHDTDYMFFTVPAMRGICEEFIVEKFIFEQFTDEKDQLIILKSNYDRLKSSIAQWQYFKMYRGDQNLYFENDFPEKLKETETELRKIIKHKLPNIPTKSIFPSIHYMSKATGLVELYDYLYHATSTFVHFHPHNLLRMAWGNLPNLQYSTSNFKSYYKDFSTFYSALLLSKLCEWQQANGYLPNFDIKNVNALNDVLQKARRWPEIITFEEMNIGVLSRILLYKSPNMTKKAD